MTAFDGATREAVRKRTGDRCDLCGLPVKVAHFHHRRPRGMGGTIRNGSGDPSNCLLLHPRCHGEVESSRERSLKNGWLVSQHQEPSEIPVKLWLGFRLLRADGTMAELLGEASSA